LMMLDKDTRGMYDLTSDTSRGAFRLEVVFVESPQDFLKDFRVVFDLSMIREITLGRGPDNIIVIPDPTVSRKHAVMFSADEGYVIIKDLGSTNGTYVFENGIFRRINEYRIVGESMVRLGYYTMIRIRLI